MDILIVLESSNGKIHRMSLEAISAAQNLASELDLKIAALAMGENANALCEEASRFNLEEIIKVENDLLLEYSSDGYAETLNQVISRENPKFIFFGHTYQVRDYVPRLSAKLMKPFLADNVA
ncbi:MAG: electron transfer flavoprotein subunit alpha/FixB family protein, partial [Candidatus Neomarinimicrobiota bacterium]|nr:electron transfer flavoprotein subunit alpha/FixB family protein [Candidatus Neomarinimicrobiota bacterium]